MAISKYSWRIQKLIDIIKLIRLKHWIKNGLIFAALLFSGRFFESKSFITVLIGTISFCFISSAIYIINDIFDIESDRNHEVKCKRPLASGAISVKSAILIVCILILLSFTLLITIHSQISVWILVLGYLIINIAYSMGLKKKPILDIFILMSGFVIRMIFGAQIIQQPISYWLYFNVMSMAFYLALGKRRNELIKLGNQAANVRSVLKYYNVQFLDKNMYMCLALTIIFYALWTVDNNTISRFGSDLLSWTVPIVIFICMRYSLIIETAEYADPVDVLLGDKTLIILVLLYGATIIFLIASRLY